jgi:hypothetical protein
MDEGDAVPGGLGGVARRVRSALQAHGAGIGLEDPADHVHERALAGAVLADQAEDPSLPHGERDPLQRVDAEEGLVDALEFEVGLHAHDAPARTCVSLARSL